MKRCLELARLGIANVAPNPMVGAVLVHDGRIIGEGYHHQYGQAHAEVNCIASVADADRELISRSTLYVSLEPCAHFGKTPPCADLIIQQHIPRVVIGSRDPFKQVDGKGIEKLQASGVYVEVGIMTKECRDLNKRFFTFHTERRPYIILKWAETKDGFIASQDPSAYWPGNVDEPGKGKIVHSRFQISNEFSNRLVHKWRSEEAAILVGTNTALLDNPKLTTRLWPGHSPVRLVLDMNLRLPVDLELFSREARTIIFNSVKQKDENGLLYHRLNGEHNIIHQILEALYDMNIQSVIVEGGAKMIHSFIEANSWDEARIITNQELTLGDHSGHGLRSPLLSDAILDEALKIESDIIKIFKPTGSFRELPGNNYFQ